jgi:peptidoglycan hydrolase-like protein with peptidoglycan-binding domain
VARFHAATWEGDNLPNKTKGRMLAHHGLVVHADAVDNIDADNNWFHNPKAEASAHFGIRNDGEIVQWVDTDDTAWAEVAGNHYWLSVEFESKGEPLTQAQIESGAKLFAWLWHLYRFTLQVTSDVTAEGLIHHSAGGADWGGHTMCPGNRIIEQKPQIVHRAKALLDFPVEHPSHPAHVLDDPSREHEKKHHKKDTPDWYHRVLAFHDGEKLMHGADVKHVQRKVHVKQDGFYGPNTAAKVRGFQKTHDLAVDGKVGPKTAKALSPKKKA